jgi:Squalene-hopene cyclase N-terminal domain
MASDRGRQVAPGSPNREFVFTLVSPSLTYGPVQDLPNQPPAKTPMQAVRNGLEFFSKLQLEPGNWGCEYGGPLFLLPGLVITWYVTETPIPESHKAEITNYLWARQTEEGGWGLHIEGDATVFGTALNYTILRILGVGAEDPRLIKARGLLHSMGGAVNGPHWAKFWLSVRLRIHLYLFTYFSSTLKTMKPYSCAVPSCCPHPDYFFPN